MDFRNFIQISKLWITFPRSVPVLAQSLAMGIRYYAYPVEAEFTDHARVSPRMFMSIDPLTDAWGPAEGRPTMLYLDKCWRELQALFGAKPQGPARPAYELVSGEVVMHHDGWEPFIRSLDPNQVASVAQDVGHVTKADVEAWLLDSRTEPLNAEDRDRDEELRYVMQYLGDAKTFTEQLALEERGLVYLIG